jgi:hypothetical protein
VICEAKRMWSHYFLQIYGKPPELSTPAPENGRASPYTINRCDYAALPNRLPCLAPSLHRASCERPGGL